MIEINTAGDVGVYRDAWAQATTAADVWSESMQAQAQRDREAQHAKESK